MANEQASAQAYMPDARNEQVLVHVNGQYFPRDKAMVSVFDSGFALGDGVWEGLRLVKGKLISLEAHLDRLFEGARSIDLEIGLDLLAGTHAVVQTLGGLEGPLYPLVYVLVAFFASFAERPAGSILVLSAIAYELLLWLTLPAIDAHRAALHGVFILFFGILNLLFTRAEIARVRERSNKERALEKQRLADDVKLFRLVGAPSVVRS